MVNLRKNRGAILITTFVAAAVLSVLSGAYITSSIVQNQSVQRQKDSLQSFYAAEKGIEYAFIESQNSNWGWTTHEAETDTSNDGDPDLNELLAREAGISIPTLRINNNNPRIINSADPDCPSCYEITIPSGQIVQVKAYFDPLRPDETVVLSRNTTVSATRIIRYRITRRSLYRYFYYYSTNKTFAGNVERMNFDGKNAGGIYVRGNIGLQNTAFANVTELSTNTTGSIFLNNWQYEPPYVLDDMRRPSRRDGYAPLPSLNSPYIYSPDNPYPWNNANWPPAPPGNWPPMDWRNVDGHFAGSGNNSRVFVNNVELPRSFATTPWNWDKYSGRDKNDPALSRNPEVSVQFVNEDGGVPAGYWNTLEAPNGASYFDPSFWSDKIYTRTAASETIPVNYLNTATQGSNWVSWLESTALDGIVNERNKGGYDTNVVNIEANYPALARRNGLFIDQDASGQTEVFLNGRNLEGALPAWISDNVRFFNTVRPWKDADGDGRLDAGEVDMEDVLELDIAGSLTSADIPNNGIIYIAHKNVRVVDANRLPRNLTIISPFSIYIKGNYNNPPDPNDWRPSAVITNSRVYFLSNNFNDPQTLPVTVYPREYPYELNYVSIDNFNRGNFTAVETQVRSVFGLANFDITSSGQQPADLAELQTRIRQEYNLEYKPRMPNQASPATFNVAVASPYNYEPTGYQLERWAQESWSSDPDWSANCNIKGAFIQLGDYNTGIDPLTGIDRPYSWANETDADGNLILDRNGNPIPIRDTAQSNDMILRTGQGNNPPRDRSPRIVSIDPSLEYEDRFKNPQQRPSGDFFAGSQALWEETFDFDHNT